MVKFGFDLEVVAAVRAHETVGSVDHRSHMYAVVCTRSILRSIVAEEERSLRLDSICWNCTGVEVADMEFEDFFRQ